MRSQIRWATVEDMLRRSSSASEGATYSAALASREFRAVFAAATLSVTGNVVADIVQTVLIYDRTRSPALASLSFALGFLPYANGVHSDAETQRRPLLHKLMTEEVLTPLAYATDNTVGIWYEGIEATTVVADADVDPLTGPAAYKVELVDGEIVETRFGVGRRFE